MQILGYYQQLIYEMTNNIIYEVKEMSNFILRFLKLDLLL